MVSKSHLTEMCTKTKLCTFFLKGACGRGGQCKFAHSADELKALPDLRCTKLCPVQARTGSCSVKGCAFAHDRAQLRKVHILGGQSGGGRGGRQQVVGLGGQSTEASPLGCSIGVGSDGGSPPHTRSLASLKVDESKLVLGFVSFSRQSTAMSDGEGSLSELTSSGFGRQASIDDDMGSMPVPYPPFPRNKFYKTKMCSFFLSGKCKKASSCSFAHSADEMSQLPDLTCTKLCSMVLNGETCRVQGCTFAHHQDELRNQQQQQQQQQQEALDRTSSKHPASLATSKSGLREEDGIGSFYLHQGEALRAKPWSDHMDKLSEFSPFSTNASLASTGYDDASSEFCSDSGHDSNDGASAGLALVWNSSSKQSSERRNSVARACIQEPSGPQPPMIAHPPPDSRVVLLLGLPDIHPRAVVAGKVAGRVEARKPDDDGEVQYGDRSLADAVPDIVGHHKVSCRARFEKRLSFLGDSLKVCVKNGFVEVQEPSSQQVPHLVRRRSATW
mmetsp:Transcript_26031/g.69201  ORF Transcript_26031/g.69201 Transcript_26031/m.69201 type:complete len:502 (-) Transcript_26031:386-1891(-)